MVLLLNKKSLNQKKMLKFFFNEILNSSEPNDKLKKAAEEYSSISFSGRQDLYDGFIEGAKGQQERMYSEEDMIEFHKWAFQKNRIEESDKTTKELISEWFEQFKKK